MPKRKYAVDYTSFQKRFKKANGGKGWLQKSQEVWTKVKNNPQALKRKYNELGKSEKSSQRAFFRLFKPCGDGPREASQSNTEAPEDEKKKREQLWGKGANCSITQE